MDLDIDKSKSFMVGDKDSDIDAGMAAGCKNCYKITETISLLDIVKMILEKE
jgi:histidinol phosphatase-like enzyme